MSPAPPPGKGKPGGKAAEPPPPPPPPPPPDRIEKAPTKLGMTFGAKGGADRGMQFQPVTAPAEVSADHGVRDAERLQILVRSPIFQRTENMWLERLTQRLGLAMPPAARRLGFGPWRKKYGDYTELARALEEHILPPMEKELKTELARLRPSDAPEVFLPVLAELPGDPPLHQDYLADAAAYGLSIHQDDIKHVAHSYVMMLAHAYVRRVVADKRQLGSPEVEKRTALSAEQLYVFEVNLCQYYVPQATHAYFENQPLRLFAREIANRFRKVAFGGQ